MKLYVDLATLELIEGPGFRNPIGALRFKRGDGALLEVAFLQNGTTPVTIGDPATLDIHFGIKPRNRYDVGYLVHTADWTMPAPEATSPVYQCLPSINTVELDSALGVGSSTGSKLAEITLMGEITWREGAGQPTSTRTFFVIVENDVNRGTEGIPTSAAPAYPAPQSLALLASVVRHDAAQSLSAVQQSQARANIGLTGDTEAGPAGIPTDIFALRNVSGLTLAEWALGAKMITVNSISPLIKVKTSTGYAKLLRWDGTFAAKSGTGVAATEITLTVGTAPVSPYNTRSPKFLAVFPCDASGAVVSGVLTSLACTYNHLTALDVRGLSSLTRLEVSNNQLPGIDLDGLSALTSLACADNSLTDIDLSAVPSLTSLSCGGNRISSLDLDAVPLLATLSCADNLLTSLDLDGVPLLTSLYCVGNNLGSLDVGDLPALSSLYCGGCNLTSLVVVGATALNTLNCDINSLTALDLSGMPELTMLSGMSNLLSPAAMDAMFNSLPEAADDNAGTCNMTGTGGQTATAASLDKRNAMTEGSWIIMMY